MSVSLNESTLHLAASRRSPMQISLGLVAIGAAALLVYASGSFVVTEVLGIKRLMQSILVAVLLVGALIYGMRLRPATMDPLIGFVFLILVTETFLRAQWLYVIDALSALLAL